MTLTRKELKEELDPAIELMAGILDRLETLETANADFQKEVKRHVESSSETTRNSFQRESRFIAEVMRKQESGFDGMTNVIVGERKRTDERTASGVRKIIWVVLACSFVLAVPLAILMMFIFRP